MTQIYNINECDAFYDTNWDGTLESNYKDTIFVTKTVPSPDTLAKLLKFTKNPYIYITITGYGDTIMEPGIPDWFKTLVQAKELQETTKFNGIVIRIDPIIPTQKGIEKALKIFQTAINKGFNKFTYEFFRNDKNTTEKLQKARLPVPPDIEKANPHLLFKFKEQTDKWEAQGIKIMSVFGIQDRRIPKAYKEKYGLTNSKEKAKENPQEKTCRYDCLLCQKF